MDNSETIYSEDYGQLSNNEMTNIYQTLSTTDNLDIDTNDELTYVQNSIEEFFDKQFKLIDKNIIEKDSMLLNHKFVELIKYCKQKNNYKKVGYIFLGFCYYFDLDEIIIFKNLHEKIQTLIKYSTMQICGKQYYNQTMQKNNKYKGIQITSLFSLVNK